MATYKITLISIGILILMLGITSSFNSAADGNDVIGFPLPFYEYLGGKRFPEPITRYNFNSLAFIADVIILFGIPFAILLFSKGRTYIKRKR